MCRDTDSAGFRQAVLADLFRDLQQWVGLSEADWQLMEAQLDVRQVGTRHRLQEIGQPVTQHYYIVSGLVRLFYLSPDGKELNKGFYSARHIVGNLSAVILDEASRFAIETLEPSTLVSFPFAGLMPLRERCVGWERLFNYGCQMMLVRNERREAELLTLSAKARFLQFVQNFPDYLERIPQYHIASYLGITPVALSRYKKQWLEEGGY